MKKTYEFPKAEKMVFDYSDAVVASGTQCKLEAVMTDSGALIVDGICTSQWTGIKRWVGDQA